ncbi:MAG: enoyl-CoA hydratase-related protein [Bdellovibrionota bacterium]
MGYEFIAVEQVSPGISLLTVSRPEALNALNPKVLENLERTLTDLEKDNSLRALIVTGAGEKAFVAGADIASMKGYTDKDGKKLAELGHRVFGKLADFPRPTIAAVNGFALGGGLELALSCDVLLASEKARLGLPEVTLGLIPGWGGTQRLLLRVGPGKAKEMIFSGDPIKADEAFRIGLADRLVAPEKLLDEAKALAATIASRGPEAIRRAKQAVATGLKGGLEAGLAMERKLFADCFTTQDTAEGIAAFLEKRKANFQGE